MEQQKKITKSQNGITLISLVITVVILLILAGVAISITVDETGLFSKSEQAAQKSRAAQVMETIQLVVNNNHLANISNEKATTKSELVTVLVENGVLTSEESDKLLGENGQEETDEITIGDTVVNFAGLNQPKETNKIVGEGHYNTIEECIADAENGDKVILAKTISDLDIVVDKSLHITCDENIILNNVTITIDGADVELTVSNLNFTGKSYINANNGKALFVDNVTADVTLNSADAVTNSRAAFISLGASELDNIPLLLKVTNSNIVVTGNNNPDPILGWRYIADKSLISGNTLGAEGKGNFDSVKFMNFMNNATVTIKNNTIYGAANALTLGQNNSRSNTYTAIIEDNTFYGTNVDFVWIEMNGTGTILCNVIANNNKVGDEPFKISDIKSNGRTISSGVINLEKDASGKLTGGTYSSFTSSEYIDYVRENLAEGHTLTTNADGTYSII